MCLTMGFQDAPSITPNANGWELQLPLMKILLVPLMCSYVPITR
jgi:hypothetical protein